ETFGDQLQNLRFARSEMFVETIRSAILGEQLPRVREALGNAWAEVGVAFVDFAHGANEIIGYGVLEQITAHAGLDEFADVFVFLVGRKDEYFRLRSAFGNLPRGFDSVQEG